MIALTAIAAAVVPVGALVLMGGAESASEKEQCGPQPKKIDKKPQVISLGEAKPPPPQHRPQSQRREAGPVACGVVNVEQTLGHTRGGGGFSYLNEAVYNDPQTDVRHGASAYTGDVYKDPVTGHAYACLEETLSEATYARENPAHSKVAAFDLLKPANKRDLGERLNDPLETSESMSAEMLSYRNGPRIRDQAIRSLGPNLGNHGPVRRTRSMPPGTAIGTRSTGMTLQNPVWARDAAGPGSDYAVRLPRTARADVNCSLRPDQTVPLRTGNHRPGIPEARERAPMVADPRGRQTMSSVALRHQDDSRHLAVASSKTRYGVTSTHGGGGTTWGHQGHRQGEGALLARFRDQRPANAHQRGGAKKQFGGSNLDQAWGTKTNPSAGVLSGPPTAAYRDQRHHSQTGGDMVERPSAGLASLSARDPHTADRQNFVSARNPDSNMLVPATNLSRRHEGPRLDMNPVRRRVDADHTLFKSTNISLRQRQSEPSAIDFGGIQPQQGRERDTASRNKMAAEAFARDKRLPLDSRAQQAHQAGQRRAAWSRTSRRGESAAGRQSHPLAAAPAGSQPVARHTRSGRHDGERGRTALGDGAGVEHEASAARLQGAERQVYREKASLAPKIASVLDDRGGHGGGVRAASIVPPEDRRALIAKYSRMMQDRQQQQEHSKASFQVSTRLTVEAERGNLRPPTRIENNIRLSSRVEKSDDRLQAGGIRTVEDPLQSAARPTSRRIPFE